IPLTASPSPPVLARGNASEVTANIFSATVFSSIRRLMPIPLEQTACPLRQPSSTSVALRIGRRARKPRLVLRHHLVRLYVVAGRVAAVLDRGPFTRIAAIAVSVRKIFWQFAGGIRRIAGSYPGAGPRVFLQALQLGGAFVLIARSHDR